MKRNQIKYVSFLFICLLILSGCTSKNSKELISTYANSTKNIAGKTQELLNDVEDSRLNAKALVLVSKGNAIKIEELKFNEFDKKGINKTLKYLNDFSSSLLILTSNNTTEKLSGAMSNLNGSLISLNDSTEKLVGEDELSYLSTAIFSIGSSYLDYKKYNSLKEILKLSEKAISKKLDNLSVAILQFEKPYIRALKEERRRLLKLANYPHHYYTKENNEEIRNSYVIKINEHKEIYKDLILLTNKIDSEHLRFSTISQALKEISILHKKIISSLDNDDEVSFKSIKKDIYDIKNKINAIKDFKTSIKG